MLVGKLSSVFPGLLSVEERDFFVVCPTKWFHDLWVIGDVMFVIRIFGTARKATREGGGKESIVRPLWIGDIW